MPRLPTWARDPGSLNHNLLSDPSRLPHLQKAKKVFFSHTAPFEDSEPLPPPVNPTETPLPTAVLMHGLDHSEATTPTPTPTLSTSSLPMSAPTAVRDDSCNWQPTNGYRFSGLGSLGDSPHVPSDVDSPWQSTPTPTNSEWYERTSTHVAGMIVLMLIAIIIVEVYEKIQSYKKIEPTQDLSNREGGNIDWRILVLNEKKTLNLEEKGLLEEGSEVDEGEEKDDQGDFWSA